MLNARRARALYPMAWTSETPGGCSGLARAMRTLVIARSSSLDRSLVTNQRCRCFVVGAVKLDADGPERLARLDCSLRVAMTNVILAEIDLGQTTARAVRVRVRDDIRAALTRGGRTVGDEIIEIRLGEDAFGQPVLDERSSLIIIEDARALVFGALPDNAVSAEAVSPDGERVACTIGEGVWLVVLPDNHRGAELYPVVFRDGDGAPVNPELPADWEREAIGERDSQCPACGAKAWDLVTAAWEGTGHLRNTRWGYGAYGPGRAFVCRVCGHEERIGDVFHYGRSGSGARRVQ